MRKLVGVVLFLIILPVVIYVRLRADYQNFVMVPIEVVHARLEKGISPRQVHYTEVDVKYEYEFDGVRYSSRIFECKWYGQYLILGENSYKADAKKSKNVALLNSGVKFSAWVSVNNPKHACIYRNGRFALLNANER